MTSVLYIGGTGEISRSCVQESVRRGHDVAVLNRGRRTTGADGVETVVANLRDADAYDALGDRRFDVVCQFLAFTPAAIERDVDAFADRCDQYVFISSASAYQKSAEPDPITEETPLDNPHWEYSRQKAACEDLLRTVHDDGRLPVTIVRPSHTYRTRLPAPVSDGVHQAWRMLQGKPVIVHGDGITRWTVTHADDFARAFTQLFGAPTALGSAFHITDQQSFTWDEIVAAVAAALGVDVDIVHVPVDELVEHRPAWAGPLRGDKANSLVFDNAKISGIAHGWRATVPLADGLARASAGVRDQLAAGYAPDRDLDQLFDDLASPRPAGK